MLQSETLKYTNEKGSIHFNGQKKTKQLFLRKKLTRKSAARFCRFCRNVPSGHMTDTQLSGPFRSPFVETTKGPNAGYDDQSRSADNSTYLSRPVASWWTDDGDKQDGGWRERTLPDPVPRRCLHEQLLVRSPQILQPCGWTRRGAMTRRGVWKSALNSMLPARPFFTRSKLYWGTTHVLYFPQKTFKSE